MIIFNYRPTLNFERNRITTYFPNVIKLIFGTLLEEAQIFYVASGVKDASKIIILAWKKKGFFFYCELFNHHT